jgi:uncharacterized protein (TIGR00369 family)
MADPSNPHVHHVTPGASLLGREWIGFEGDTQTALLRFHAKPEFANRHGTVQGGFLAAMLDSATGMALLAGLPPELTAVTIRLDTTFVQPAPLGQLAAKARVIARDERNATVEAELLDPSGTLVARATAELRIVRRR